MDKRSLSVGVVIGAVAAGLVFAGMVNGQEQRVLQDSKEVGRFQVSMSTVAQPGYPFQVIAAIIDTRTGDCVLRKVDMTNSPTKKVSFDGK